MCAQKEINWLHISDLHIGSRGSEVVNQISTELLPILMEHKNIHPAPPDIILITGDIANSGEPEEYKKADIFLNQLLSDLRKVYATKTDPMIIPVPGNHDLLRPKDDESINYYLFNDYAVETEDNQHIKIFNRIFESCKTPNKLSSLFSGYSAWAKPYIDSNNARSDVSIYQSHIPGDLCVLLNFNNSFPLCIVGMNSAWLQFSDDDFEGKLSIPPLQFHTLLSQCGKENPLNIFSEYKRSIFMMHHPPTWLSASAWKNFYDGIYRPERFDICMYGHMHKAKSQASSTNTEPLYYEYQSPSLCGLEHFGKKNEKRSFGFTFGLITEAGEVRIWPYKRKKKGGKQRVFDLNPDLINYVKNETSKGAVIKPGNSQLDQDDDIEGVFIRIIPITTEKTITLPSIKMFLDARLPVIVDKLGINGKVEPFECGSTKECVFYLPYRDNQTWSNLTVQAFEVLLILFKELQQERNDTKDPLFETQYGFTMHTEERGTEQFISHSSNLDFKKSNGSYQKSLPKLTRPSFLISEKIYQYLQSFSPDQVKLMEIIVKAFNISERIQPLDVDIQPIMKIPINKAELINNETAQNPSILYNLSVLTSKGKKLLGDLYLPAGYLRMDCIQSTKENNFVEQLVDAERICIVGVNNENLLSSLKSAHEKRKKINRGFWKEIRIVFLSRNLTKLIINKPINKTGIPQDKEKNITDWYMSVRLIREFLLKSQDDETENLDCLQLDYLLPFEANYFCDLDGNSTIQMFPFLSGMDDRKSICIEAGNEHPYHTLLKSTIDAIFQTATPIVEFNVFGYIDENEFKLSGLINQQGWREFSPNNNFIPCFPVSFVLLYSNIDNDPLVLLQKRTPKNSGGDFDQHSVISGIVNDEDFPFEQTAAYKNAAYRTVKKDPNDKIDWNNRLSRLFSKNIGVSLGNAIPLKEMDTAWKRTALREINEKLGLNIEESKLKSYPEDVDYEISNEKKQLNFIIDKGKFFLYTKLFWLEIKKEDIETINQLRPNANIIEFDLQGLAKSKDEKSLSTFLASEYEEFILPFLKNQLGIK